MLTDPAECGPVTLAFCQDVQAEAYDYPDSFFAERVHHPRRPPPDARELADAVAALASAKKPLVVCGGGVLYSEAESALLAFCEKRGIPISETQAGKSATPADHPLHVGGIGVSGTERRQSPRRGGRRRAGGRDAVQRLHERLLGSVQESEPPLHRPQHAAVRRGQASRACRWSPTRARGWARSTPALGDWRAPAAWAEFAAKAKREWLADRGALSRADQCGDPDRRAGARRADALGQGPTTSWSAPREACPETCTNCGRRGAPLGYHMEYGYSCMGYEIAGGLGVKLAHPDREVIVVVGDGSYLMMNSEIATSVMLGLKLIIVVTDNRGFACINRLQRATGGESFNNLLRDARHEVLPEVDFVAHARSLGAHAVKAASIAELESALEAARAATTTRVIVLDTDPINTTDAGGAWWNVAVPATSTRPEVVKAREANTRKRWRPSA